MVKRLILLITTISVCIFLLLTVLTESKANETIKLGVAGAHSGEFAKYGIPMLRAAEMVVKETNDHGGIFGKKIELIAKDDKCGKQLGAKVAKAFVSEDVRIVMGHMCSASTWAAIDKYKNAKLIVMSPSATDPRLTQGKYPNFYRLAAPDDLEAKLQVDLALNKLGLRKLAVIHDKSDYGKVLAKTVNSYLKKDKRAKVALFKDISPGAKDYAKVIKNIESSNADGVIYCGYYTEASKMLAEMRKKNMTTLFISDNGVKDEDFIKITGEFAEGVFVSGEKDSKNNPAAKKVQQAYQKLYGTEPGMYFLNAYAATQILIAATESAGSTDYAALKEVLHKDTFETPIGKIRFDANGDPINVGFIIYQVKNGAFVEYN
ncbi:MAG: branched-chain amino acid ABC transporter substrate-binding protein [Desulfobacterales bacterium]